MRCGGISCCCSRRSIARNEAWIAAGWGTPARNRGPKQRQAGRLHTRTYPLDAINDAMADLDQERLHGRGILVPAGAR
jgi:hypothetical protein